MLGDRTTHVPAVLASAVFLFGVPGTVVGLGPWWICRWRVQAPFPSLFFLRAVGAVLVIGPRCPTGSFGRFALEGLGTPAPVSPPRRFVASGPYRYVRNPMYVGVVSTNVGQALFFGSVQLLAYGALVAVVVHMFVVAYEEPRLRAPFGEEYEAFCADVPRWLPRVRPRGARHS